MRYPRIRTLVIEGEKLPYRPAYLVLLFSVRERRKWNELVREVEEARAGEERALRELARLSMTTESLHRDSPGNAWGFGEDP